jgi:SAM-dependent methyltransferase
MSLLVLSPLLVLKRLRKLVIHNPGFSFDEIHTIRRAEFDHSFPSDFFTSRSVLEVGGSDGFMASLILSQNPSSLKSFDLEPVFPSFFPVERTTSFLDQHSLNICSSSIEIVFSSNTFEHIKDLDFLLGECRRVLIPGGLLVLLLPNHIWRLASIFNGFINLLPALPHGIHSHNAFTEAYRFWPQWWVRRVCDAGFELEQLYPAGFFYAEPRLLSLASESLKWRSQVASIVGSSSHCFIFRLPNS